MAVIAIMASLLMSALGSAKEKSRSMMCRSNMKQLSYAFHMYADENDDYFPWPGGEPDRANYNIDYAADWCAGGQQPEDIRDSSRWSDDSFGFHAESGSIFPYVMSQERKPYREKEKTIYPIYRCPSTGRLGEALRVNYAANAYLDPGQPFGQSVVSSKGVRTTSVRDPARKVLLANEDPKLLCGAGFAPSRSAAPGTPVNHQGRSNLSFIDSHVESLSLRSIQSMRTQSVDAYYNLGE